MKRLARQINQEVSLTYLMLRDGTIYFVMLFVLEIFSTIGQYVTVLAGVPGFTFALETVVLSRFLLDLRRTALRLSVAAGPRAGESSTSASGSLIDLSELRFNSRILGSLGGSLALGSSDEESNGMLGSLDGSTDVDDPDQIKEVAAQR
ncbi:hypothetical protein EVJ58_g2801 [Rhodofomes roseus]|uniref:Uncharacterized protein n=1 Tax=Rhodofomes roseus TaxID=34475 RepID=A0A4Y9YNI0_9APHY|nr:hypothetical protein EVJ58_g2801 [Rhodofomes roseus]